MAYIEYLRLTRSAILRRNEPMSIALANGKHPCHLLILEGVYENPDEVAEGKSMRLAVVTCFM